MTILFEQFGLKESDLPDQIIEGSKYTNFFLTYKCSHGNVLDPMIREITKEIEDSEFNLPPSDNGRYPRKKKRPANANRRFKQAIRILILNLLQVHEIKDAAVCLAISLDANSYTNKGRYSPPDMTYDPFIEAYDGLHRLGYLAVKHEGFYDAYENSGLSTRITATEQLVELYKDTTEGKRVILITRNITAKDKDELIILKGKKPNNPKINIKLPYEDNNFTRKARTSLKKINSIISKHEIKIEDSPEIRKALRVALKNKKADDPEKLSYIDYSAVRLYRIFSDNSFKRGGRFYRGWWQQVPSDFRQHITIDGQKTVELDYSRFHISMAYAQIGLKPPTDAYAIHPKVHNDISKRAINALFNSKGVPKQHEDFKPSEAGMSWRQFINLILKVHNPINEANLFMSRHGLTLQFEDSQIAETVLLHFAKKGIPCLPIHDSFIVEQSRKEELAEVMHKAYKDKYSLDININHK